MATATPSSAPIIAAGYDGYVATSDGVPGRAAVLLGTKNVPVNALGTVDLEGLTGGITRVAQPGDAEDARGYLEFGTNLDGSPRRFDMVLLKSENKSTVLHELGHLYLEMLNGLAMEPDASEDIKADFAAVLQWFGVTTAQWAHMTPEQKRPTTSSSPTRTSSTCAKARLLRGSPDPLPEVQQVAHQDRRAAARREGGHE